MNKPRYVLFLYNNAYPKDGVEKWTQWYENTFPFVCVLETKKVSVPLTFKYFMSVTENGVERPLYGLDDIKEKLRPYVPLGEYHEVIFHYEKPQGGPDLACWTYPNLLQGASFSELVSTPTQDTQDDLTYYTNRHETFHRLHRELWAKKIPTQDTMDRHDFPANEERNLMQIRPYYAFLEQQPPAKFIVYLQGLVKSLQNALARLKGSHIPDWAAAIKEWEGWGGPGSTVQGVYFPKGTPSYRNNNPGNLKNVGQPGVIGTDNQGHAIFKDYQAGWNALIRQLTIAANGTSTSFQKTMTLIEFHSKYAEANGVGYANFVAKRLGVPPQTQIYKLL